MWVRAGAEAGGAAFDLYPRRVRFSVLGELLSRALLTICAVWLIVLLPPIFWIVAVSLFVLRELVMILSVRMIARRVGERGLLWAYLLYDLYAPVAELFLWISRKLRPSQRLWI